MQWPLLVLLFCLSAAPPAQDDAYLRWSASQAESAANSTERNGKVGQGWFDGRGLKTESAINYKLRVTWFTPEVLRGSARLLQLRSRLTDAETARLLTEAEAAGGTVIMVDIDPKEGSGVIPESWEAFLQPAGDSSATSAARGVKAPELRKLEIFQGARKRNYDYDRYWVIFPLHKSDGSALFSPSATTAELIVRIHNKEGKVSWPIPESIRQRVSTSPKAPPANEE